MAEELSRLRRVSSYPMDSDWVFASPTMRGKQPYWHDNLMKRYIRPIAQKEMHRVSERAGKSAMRSSDRNNFRFQPRRRFFIKMKNRFSKRFKWRKRTGCPQL
jgi:hypothetical protein